MQIVLSHPTNIDAMANRLFWKRESDKERGLQSSVNAIAISETMTDWEP